MSKPIEAITRLTAPSNPDSDLALVQTYLKDKIYDLAERWAVYLEVESVLPVSDYVIKGTADYVDDAYMRHQTLELSMLVEQDKERIDEEQEDFNKDDPEERKEGELYYKEEMDSHNKFRELILQSGYGQMKFDW